MERSSVSLAIVVVLTSTGVHWLPSQGQASGVALSLQAPLVSALDSVGNLPDDSHSVRPLLPLLRSSVTGYASRSVDSPSRTHGSCPFQRSILRFGYRSRGRLRGTSLALRVVMRCELNRLLSEVARLGAGGEMTEQLASSLSVEERVVFEIGLIETLSRGTPDQQRCLRRALIKCGYDEQCARRAMRDAISDRVRASTLLVLLHPRSKRKTSERSQAAVRSR